MIARLNIGGPSIQAITLTRRLEDHGYRTTLVRGREQPDEGSMDHLARALGVEAVRVPWLRRNPGWHDIPALIALIGIVRRERPQIVHTHAAKGGTLGRLATLIAAGWQRPRPVLIHTFHGHSLRGYFSPRTAAVYRGIERLLAWRTDRLIAVSAEVRDDLVTLGVAPPWKFEVVPLGFDLEPFMVSGATRAGLRAAVREELGIAPGATVVTLIARLVPIKRVDRFLRVAASLADLPEVCFVIVGDGELRDELRGRVECRGLGDRLLWTGFRRDMPAVCCASDVVVLTSDNEGTPVSLIEAQAAGVAVVSTNVGGAASVVHDGETGFLVGPDEEEAMAGAIRRLCRDSGLAERLGSAGRRHVSTRFGLERLVTDVARLYEAELAVRRRRHPSTGLQDA
jgi:glycosyltransferase involved in cell wall biosynthesis